MVTWVQDDPRRVLPVSDVARRVVSDEGCRRRLRRRGLIHRTVRALEAGLNRIPLTVGRSASNESERSGAAGRDAFLSWQDGPPEPLSRRVAAWFLHFALAAGLEGFDRKGAPMTTASTMPVKAATTPLTSNSFLTACSGTLSPEGASPSEAT